MLLTLPPGDTSVLITYEKAAIDSTKAELYKLPPNFYNIPEKACTGCLGCPDFSDMHEIGETFKLE